MPFTERAKLTALAIVQVFETGKPFGDYSAVAVLNDGAGISYGIKQFTHKSGSLYAVVQRFVKLGGQLPPIIEAVLGHLKDKNHIAPVANNKQVKDAFKALGKDARMQKAQREIAFEKYLNPAIEACEGSDFIFPLSLAVVYDSKIHGSFDKIRDRVVVNRPGNGSMKEEEYEREWITRYVKKRDAWLESIPRLAATDYRTDFFLAQIARGNWELSLPVTVQGVRLTSEMVNTVGDTFADLADDEVDGLLDIPTNSPATPPIPVNAVSNLQDPAVQGTPGNSLAIESKDEQPGSTQIAEQIINTGDVPANFTPETVAITAPPATGFLGKLKAGVASLLASVGGFVGLKEYFAVQLSPDVVEILKIAVPSILGLGFIGFLFWYVTEKVVGYQTLKLKATLRADPTKHNPVIIPADETSRWRFW